MTMDNKTNKDMTMDNKTNKGMDKTMTMTMEGTGKRYIQFCAWSSSSIGNGIYGFHGDGWSHEIPKSYQSLLIDNEME